MISELFKGKTFLDRAEKANKLLSDLTESESLGIFHTSKFSSESALSSSSVASFPLSLMGSNSWTIIRYDVAVDKAPEARQRRTSVWVSPTTLKKNFLSFRAIQHIPKGCIRFASAPDNDFEKELRETSINK